MYTPYVLTVEQVKTYLGIADTTHDSSIGVYLPIVSDFLVGISGYLNKEWLIEKHGAVTETSAEITDIDPDGINVGDVVESPSFNSGSIVVSVDTINRTVTLDSAAIASDDLETISFRVLPIGAKPTVAQMVWYKIGAGSTTGTGSQYADVASKSYDGVSVSFANGSSGSISSNGYPTKLLKGLRPYARVTFA